MAEMAADFPTGGWRRRTKMVKAGLEQSISDEVKTWRADTPDLNRPPPPVGLPVATVSAHRHRRKSPRPTVYGAVKALVYADSQPSVNQVTHPVQIPRSDRPVPQGAKESSRDLQSPVVKP